MSAPSSNWKHPSAQQKQKYGLVDLPDNFEPTEQETMLLDMYKTVQTYEKHATRLNQEAARAKLAAAEEEFNKRKKPKKNPRIQNDTKTSAGDGRPAVEGEGEPASDDERNAADDDQLELDKASLRMRREAKLEALRIEVEEAKQQKQSEEDVLRQQLLQEQEPMLEGPVLKRKRMEATEGEGNKSLIANLTSANTPPHDFSKSLNLSVTQGRNLFPTISDEQRIWTPPVYAVAPNEGALNLRLTGFNFAAAQNGHGENTLAIKFMAPSDSKRFSLNIITPQHEKDMDSVLFHFNPRQRAGQIVVNDKQDGTWGQEIALPLSQVPLIFGQTSCTLVIQITGYGFDLFLRASDVESSGDGLVHIARWEHKEELSGTDLVLQFPSTDDYGNLENWTVYKVWWGNQPIRAKENAQVTGVNTAVNAFRAEHPRKLFLSKLPKLHTQADVDIRRAELERAFRKFGGDRGVSVIAPMNATYAFIEMENERQADEALMEMKSSQYRVERARRSRHEALREERAAKEAAGEAVANSTSEW